MKLTTTTQVSVDGVMQANGPSEEERMAGFERDGWAMGHFDNESRTFVDQVYQRADAFLFGRWTYDIFAGDRFGHVAHQLTDPGVVNRSHGVGRRAPDAGRRQVGVL